MHATCNLEIVNKSIVTDREATLRLYVYLSPMILNEPDKSIFLLMLLSGANQQVHTTPIQYNMTKKEHIMTQQQV